MVDAWGAAIFGGLGADGTAKFEFTGSVELIGKPFDVSSAESREIPLEQPGPFV